MLKKKSRIPIGGRERTKWRRRRAGLEEARGSKIFISGAYRKTNIKTTRRFLTKNLNIKEEGRNKEKKKN